MRHFLPFQGLVGAFFIKCNLYWSKLRKTTVLGKYPISEVRFIRSFICSLIHSLIHSAMVYLVTFLTLSFIRLIILILFLLLQKLKHHPFFFRRTQFCFEIYFSHVSFSKLIISFLSICQFYNSKFHDGEAFYIDQRVMNLEVIKSVFLHMFLSISISVYPLI